MLGRRRFGSAAVNTRDSHQSEGQASAASPYRLRPFINHKLTRVERENGVLITYLSRESAWLPSEEIEQLVESGKLIPRPGLFFLERVRKKLCGINRSNGNLQWKVDRSVVLIEGREIPQVATLLALSDEQKEWLGLETLIKHRVLGSDYVTTDLGAARIQTFCRFDLRAVSTGSGRL